MARPSLSLRLTGAQVLCGGTLCHADLAIDRGRIAQHAATPIDLTGYYLLPGIIDMHGDAFERHIAPRPSAPFPVETGLRATDLDAAANGVTTAWLAQSWSWEGGHRGPEFAETLLHALDLYRPRALCDLRVQLRCETHTVETEARLLSAVERHGVDYVVFNNHLDEALAMAAAQSTDLALWAKKAGRSPEEHMLLVRRAKQEAPRVPRYLCRLADRFDRLGVTYGSHDDPDGETRETFSMIGARICEFPTARAAAASARVAGDHVVMGAPNVVRGGSQSGNIAALALIRAGLCDALVSDYYYPALHRAAFRLVQDGVRTLPQAWAMISTVPAQLMGLADRGCLALGKRADLVIVNATTQAIEGTIAAGRITHLSGDAALRFLARPDRLGLAAE